VVGIAEAAMHVATLIANSFTIVSTQARSAPALEHLVLKYGFAHKCRGVRTAEFPVLALEDPASGAVDRLRAVRDRIDPGRVIVAKHPLD
jgi:allantoin racemase